MFSITAVRVLAGAVTTPGHRRMAHYWHFTKTTEKSSFFAPVRVPAKELMICGSSSKHHGWDRCAAGAGSAWWETNVWSPGFAAVRAGAGGRSGAAMLSQVVREELGVPPNGPA